MQGQWPDAHEIEDRGAAEKIFQMGYCEVYGEERGPATARHCRNTSRQNSPRADHLVLLTAVSAVLWLIYRMGAWILERYFRKRSDRNCFDAHLAIVLALCIGERLFFYIQKYILCRQLITGRTEFNGREKKEKDIYYCGYFISGSRAFLKKHICKS